MNRRTFATAATASTLGLLGCLFGRGRARRIRRRRSRQSARAAAMQTCRVQVWQDKPAHKVQDFISQGVPEMDLQRGQWMTATRVG